MMSPDQNELITRIGPGTKCGALMRHYWHPVALADELLTKVAVLSAKSGAAAGDGDGKAAVRAAHAAGDLGLADRLVLALAIGPEGGWTQFELELLSKAGFNSEFF